MAKNKTKTVNIVFLIVIVCLAVACAIHTALTYISIANTPSTGAPASVAFFLTIPYAVSMIVVGGIWLVVGRIVGKKIKK